MHVTSDKTDNFFFFAAQLNSYKHSVYINILSCLNTIYHRWQLALGCERKGLNMRSPFFKARESLSEGSNKYLQYPNETRLPAFFSPKYTKANIQSTHCTLLCSHAIIKDGVFLLLIWIIIQSWLFLQKKRKKLPCRGT